MYTPAQVSDMLGIPPSTLRRYAKVYEAQLSDQTGRVRRLYSEHDINTFAKVHELSKQNFTAERIKALLDVREVPTAETAESSLSLVPSIAREIETAQTAAQAALSQIAALAAQFEAQNVRIQELENYLSLPFYKRLFIRRPRI